MGELEEKIKEVEKAEEDFQAKLKAVLPEILEECFRYLEDLGEKFLLITEGIYKEKIKPDYREDIKPVGYRTYYLSPQEFSRVEKVFDKGRKEVSLSREEFLQEASCSRGLALKLYRAYQRIKEQYKEKNKKEGIEVSITELLTF